MPDEHLYPADHDPPGSDPQSQALANCIVAMNGATQYLSGMPEKELDYFKQVLREAVEAHYGEKWRP